MSSVPSFLDVLPTRVRRNYRGGALLDARAGRTPARDGDEPEDWIASTTEAKNPGLPPRLREGITRVRRPDGGESDLATEIARAPEHWLGAAHVQALGPELGFLAKLLDSSIRLHIQAHPTAAFAREHLNSPYGKFESYVILGARAGCDPYVLLGFKRALSDEAWRRIIAEQDLTAMHACLHRIPIRVGEVWIVPGGMPHAIGEGVLMLEVMEPSDWVVRCEFEREGIVVPPAARFMGRDLDFSLGVFDYRTASEDEIRRRCCVTPRVRMQRPGVVEEDLIGPTHTDCYTVWRIRAGAPAELFGRGRFQLLLATAGAGTLVGTGFSIPIRRGTRVLLPALCADCRIEPAHGGELEIVQCLPGGL